MTKIIHIEDKVFNPDDTISINAALAVYDENGKFTHHMSRSPFSFANTISDQEIIDFLWANDYAKYL